MVRESLQRPDRWTTIARIVGLATKVVALAEMIRRLFS
jgi:hypothetical protein